jgi:DNA-binding PadR family transcriptional regulator
MREYVMLKVLDMVSREPMHGYRIMKEIEKEIGIRLSPGVLYPILRSMVDMGLLSAYETSVGGKKVVVYEVTQDGREYLEKHRERLRMHDARIERFRRSGLLELFKRVREIVRSIDKLSDEDVERVRRAVELFLNEVKSVG